MKPTSESEPGPDHQIDPRRTGPRWLPGWWPSGRVLSVRGIAPKMAAATAFGLAGLLAVTTSLHAGGTDLRVEQGVDLAGLVRSQIHDKQVLDQQVDDLRTEINELSRSAAGVDNSRVQQQAAELADKAGLTALSGPGLTVILDDAPPDSRGKADDLDALVVHQQDIQAVANALWAGGAEAMTIQDQRVISTSAIRCVGNSVVLHGVPYPPAYRISAIGDPQQLRAALDASPGVQAYLQDARVLGLGYETIDSALLEMPAFEGSTDLSYASSLES